MENLTQRQQLILDFIERNNKVSNQEIKNYIETETKETFSRMTIVRDIEVLLSKELIIKDGAGRSIKYRFKILNEKLSYIDVAQYFDKNIEERLLKSERYNFNIHNDIDNLLSIKEIKDIEILNKNYQKRIKSLSPVLLKKEFERLTIEFSWKSSQIEGNTYSLIDTESLIKYNEKAKGHSKEESVMILNHKNTIDYIFANKNKFKKISLKNIEEIHRLLTMDLNIPFGIRKNIVAITGTKYRPLDNSYQIQEALTNTINSINKEKNVIVKMILANALLAYLQPFEDGNKRTSRILGNAILIANDYCPLSFRSIKTSDYKKAILLFYEQNNLRYLKKLLIQQFRFSVETYFQSLNS